MSQAEEQPDRSAIMATARKAAARWEKQEAARRAADSDAVIQALNERHAQTVDRFNTLLRFCQAIPLLIEVEPGRSDRMVKLDQMYLDQLGKLVERCKP